MMLFRAPRNSAPEIHNNHKPCRMRSDHRYGFRATRWPGMTAIESHRSSDPLLELRLRRGADLARLELAVLEQHQGRDRHDAELGRRAGILVDVELDDLD